MEALCWADSGYSELSELSNGWESHPRSYSHPDYLDARNLHTTQSNREADSGECGKGHRGCKIVSHFILASFVLQTLCLLITPDSFISARPMIRLAWS